MNNLKLMHLFLIIYIYIYIYIYYYLLNQWIAHFARFDGYRNLEYARVSASKFGTTIKMAPRFATVSEDDIFVIN